jgi:hypothetical protein
VFFFFFEQKHIFFLWETWFYDKEIKVNIYKNINDLNQSEKIHLFNQNFIFLSIYFHFCLDKNMFLLLKEYF